LTSPGFSIIAQSGWIRKGSQTILRRQFLFKVLKIGYKLKVKNNNPVVICTISYLSVIKTTKNFTKKVPVPAKIFLHFVAPGYGFRIRIHNLLNQDLIRIHNPDFNYKKHKKEKGVTEDC
jgi:hypothetical protein